MKILYATYWYLPHEGGVNTYLELIKEELLSAGHQVDILAHHPDMDKIYLPTSGKYIEKAQLKDVVYQKVLNYYNRYQPYVEPWIRWREIERYTFELAATLFELDQYDIIHTQDLVSTRALSRVKPKEVPLVATLHGLLAPEYLKNGEITTRRSLPWRYALLEEYHGATSADCTIVPSDYLKKRFNKLGIPAEHFVTIPYAINRGQFERRCQEKKDQFIPFVEKGKTVILCPVPFLASQGHPELIEALAMLKRKGHAFVCWLAGSGKRDQEIIAMTHRFHLQDDVLFLGERPNMAPLLTASDIILLPGLEENNPYAIMEGHLAGKLVVASHVGSTPELIEHGRSGLLFPPKKSRQLAKVLDQALSNREKSSQIARQGYDLGKEKWDSKRMIHRLLEIYEKLLHSPSSRKEDPHENKKGHPLPIQPQDQPSLSL